MAITLNGTTGLESPGITDTGNMSVAGNTTLSIPLPIAGGGTNTNVTPTAGTVPYGTGTALAYTATGSPGQALLSNGSSPPTCGTAGTSQAKTTAISIVFGF